MKFSSSRTGGLGPKRCHQNPLISLLLRYCWNQYYCLCQRYRLVDQSMALPSKIIQSPFLNPCEVPLTFPSVLALSAGRVSDFAPAIEVVAFRFGSSPLKGPRLSLGDCLINSHLCGDAALRGFCRVCGINSICFSACRTVSTGPGCGLQLTELCWYVSSWQDWSRSNGGRYS